VLSEGGPSLNGQLIAEDLIDEWNLTISPILAGGTSKRPATGQELLPPGLAMALDRVWHQDDLLFCRWIRRTHA
jgi:5-amino-6-(5-phosphoribosylamino)uracil reductase